MRSLISGLWGRLKYNHGLRGVVDRCTACGSGFIRVGLRSAVIKPTSLVLGFAIIAGMAGQADAQVTFSDANLEAARKRDSSL